MPENTGIFWKDKNVPEFGIIPIPSGAEWINYGEYMFGNKQLSCVITLQLQKGDFTKQAIDYIYNYKELSKKDAPGYKLISQKQGIVNGITAARVIGKFDNGTSFVTRDYLFFSNKGVYIIQGRIKEENSETLDKIIDHIVTHLTIKS